MLSYLLGELDRCQGDYEQASARFKESLTRLREVDEGSLATWDRKWRIAPLCLEGLAKVAWAPPAQEDKT